jgi:hypothetical protein
MAVAMMDGFLIWETHERKRPETVETRIDAAQAKVVGSCGGEYRKLQ